MAQLTHQSDALVFLRMAELKDVALLTYWDTLEHVVESDPNDDWNWEEELGREVFWREQLIAEVDGKAIGFIQIIDPHFEETNYWGSVSQNLRAIDIWIGEKDYLGKGYGTHIMHLVISRCFADVTVSSILIDPLANNTRAHKFYEQLGFQFVERRHFGEDDCFVYELSRKNYLAKHLSKGIQVKS